MLLRKHSEGTKYLLVKSCNSQTGQGLLTSLSSLKKTHLWTKATHLNYFFNFICYFLNIQFENSIPDTVPHTRVPHTLHILPPNKIISWRSCGSAFLCHIQDGYPYPRSAKLTPTREGGGSYHRLRSPNPWVNVLPPLPCSSTCGTRGDNGKELLHLSQ